MDSQTGLATPFWAAVAIALSSLNVSSGQATAQNAPQVCPANANVEIQHDEKRFVTKLKIGTEDGKLIWRDLLCGLARARGYDDGELVDVLPSGGLTLDRAWAQATILAMNRLGRPYLSFAITNQLDSPEKTLVVGLNRLVLLESKRRFKQRMKSLLTVPDVRRDRSQFGMQRPAKLSKKSDQMVVSIHGYNAFSDDMKHVMSAPRAAGLPCGRFTYPNDQPIDESARLLSRELAHLANDYPQLKISLVTHSMGGLVARRVIEDPALDPGIVQRLIMIAPPNHGSELARFAFAMDLWQLLSNRRRGQHLSFFYTSIEDGLAEAATDLQPDSIFLAQLNRNGCNKKVDYTIFLGNQAPLRHEDVADLRNHIQSAGRKSRWIRFFGGKLDGMIEDLDGLVDEHGDGVVSLQSGRLEGVEDVVILPFSHTSVLKKPESEAARQVRKGITERITGRFAMGK